MRVLGSQLGTAGSASLVGIRMNAGYSETLEITNEFIRIKFSGIAGLSADPNLGLRPLSCTRRTATAPIAGA